MNERIKELAKEHYCRTEYDNGNVHECYEFSEAEIEKFVESIIQICTEQIAIERGTTQCYDDWDFGTRAGLSQAIETLNNYFGVEE